MTTEAIGTMKVTRTGDVVSNVPSSSNQMAERGELFSYEQPHKTLQREGHNVTYDVDYDFVDGEFVVVYTQTKYSRASKEARKE